MKLKAIDLREIRLQLRRPFVTSRGTVSERRVLLVRIEDENGVEGWAECSVFETPFYTEEWLDGAWTVLRDFLAPLAIGKEIAHPSEMSGVLGVVSGNRMAKAAIENACWHLESERRAVPLSKLLGGTRTSVAAAVAIGVKDSRDALLDAIAEELSCGYRRIKLKIGRGDDVELLENVRERFPDAPLSVDANGAYAVDDGAKLSTLDRFELKMIEQPFGPSEWSAHASLQKKMRTAVCLDESILSAADASLAVELGACRIINVKSARVGGHSSALAIEQVCRERGISAWCGGMLESGIGRAHNIALASLEGFDLPSEVSASSRYWEADIIEPPVTVEPDGSVRVSDRPGLGFEVDTNLVDRITVRAESIRS